MVILSLKSCNDVLSIFIAFLAAELLIVTWLPLNHVLSIANVLPYVNTFYEKSQRFFVKPVENSLPVEYIAIFFIESNDNTF
nr:MAG TPA: hypothetical protein [Caudoviricetes sp.]